MQLLSKSCKHHNAMVHYYPGALLIALIKKRCSSILDDGLGYLETRRKKKKKR
jgi:hypothetical protein